MFLNVSKARMKFLVRMTGQKREHKEGFFQFQTTSHLAHPLWKALSICLQSPAIVKTICSSFEKTDAEITTEISCGYAAVTVNLAEWLVLLRLACMLQSWQFCSKLGGMFILVK